MVNRDRHHILFPRLEWNLRPDARLLRGNSTLIPMLDRSVHEEIHRQCSQVPLLGHNALELTRLSFIPRIGDTLGSIDSLIMSIEKSKHRLKCPPIDKQLADLAIEAILLQRPLIASDIAKQTYII